MQQVGFGVFFLSILYSSTRARPVLVKKHELFSLLGKQRDTFPGKLYIFGKVSSAQTVLANPILVSVMNIARARHVLDFRSAFHEISCTCFGHLLLHMQIKPIVEFLFAIITGPIL